MLIFKISMLDPCTYLVSNKNFEGQSLSSRTLIQAVLSSQRYRVYSGHLNALVGKSQRQLKLGVDLELQLMAANYTHYNKHIPLDQRQYISLFNVRFFIEK